MKMRPFKFRAWDAERKQMLSAEEMNIEHLTLMTDGRGLINVSGYSPELNGFVGDVMIPLQFAGVLDKNDKEIYQGDLLTISCEGMLQEGYYEVSGLREFYEALDTLDRYLQITPLEVIGNIYENEDLLK